MVGDRLKPFSQNGFQSRFVKIIQKLVAEEKVGPGLSYLGQRHTTRKNLAEAGCSTEDIMAILGVTRQMAEHDSKEAKRLVQARSAILKLERNTAGKWKNRRG